MKFTEKQLILIDDYGFYVAGIARDKKGVKSWKTFDEWKKIKDHLEYLRGAIKAENISYEEIAELQSLIPYIDDGDVELLEWAGVPENGVTAKDVEKWIGSDDTQDKIMEVLVDIANGKYSPEELRSDIASYE